MIIRELMQIPNLLSLSRIFIAPVIGYYIWLDNPTASAIAAVLMFLAGITDGLDGYMARRLGQVSNLGVALDPICDKIMAAIIVIFVLLFRDFPFWLVAIILGRDLGIMILGSILLRGRDLTLPSNLSGKYAFGCIASLLFSYIIRYDFGIQLFLYPSLILLATSTIGYTRVFLAVRRDLPPPLFKDKPLYANIRLYGSLLYVLVFTVQLVREFFL
jgi:CDP-diacylglycerol--glycerol-3-phosphate 3-phosphatidyltransferase